MKENHKQWADMTLKGIKQRLYDCGKIENDLQLNIQALAEVPKQRLGPKLSAN